ncbi:MAG TPA: hypothetical protein VGE44_11960 [Daejeonella sp.]|uniref:hypothetical protein n=1 Tax=Daejeonella sp. TaxID=2805397 RepID=UPI002EDB6E87
MKSINLNFIYLLSLIIGLSSCVKEESSLQLPAPLEMNTFRIMLDSLPDGSAYDTSDLFAFVTIKNDKDEDVLSNKKLLISFNGKYVTEKIKLDPGNYKISSLIIGNGDSYTQFAAPKANSAKASEVQKPLNISFKLENADIFDLPVEVVKVLNEDKAENFGYQTADFKIQSIDENKFIKVKLQAVIRVGDIIYDNIPTLFKLSNWDSNGVLTEKDTLLAGGVNEIFLPKSGVKYQFKLSKWGVSDEMTLNKDQISEGVVYTLGGAKSPKKLRLEEQFTFTQAGYMPSGKTIYNYDPNGNLKQIDFYDKVPQYSDLRLSWSKVYVYSNAKLSKINYINDQGTFVGYLELTYNTEGTKIIKMKEVNYDQVTNAQLEYQFPTGYARINFKYTFSNGNTMDYVQKIIGGNRTEDSASSPGGGESGLYQYDFNINPYTHMNMPNIFLSNLPKNNLVNQKKTYSGSIPSAEPYKFEYSYDDDGYPKELIKSFKNYLNGEHLFKIKTVYSY